MTRLPDRQRKEVYSSAISLTLSHLNALESSALRFRGDVNVNCEGNEGHVEFTENVERI